MVESKSLTHIAGTFLIEADASFLNGAGLGSGEYENYSIIKTFHDGLSSEGYYKTPFISAASWRRWLRDTLIEETGWEESKIRALHENQRGNTDKIGGEKNPVRFAEDDLFGFMHTISKEAGKAAQEESEEGEEEVKLEGTKIRGLFRTSAFSSSILVGLRKDGWEGRDQNYVGLVEGSSQPYKTQFMNTALQGVFCLNYTRLGVFANVGDKQELDLEFVRKYLADNTLVEIQKPEFFSLERSEIEEKGKKKKQFKVITKPGSVYQLTNNKTRVDRASQLLKSLAILRGEQNKQRLGQMFRQK